MVLALVAFNSSAFAQRSPIPVIDRDPVLEQDAKHNLDVAWQAFGPAKKAYKQVLGRFEETYAAYPEFSKMDEFLYLAGMSSYYLSENKGKQKLDPKSEKDKDKYSPSGHSNRAYRGMESTMRFSPSFSKNSTVSTGFSE